LEVNFAFLCDYAAQSGGKMTAVGIGIDTIYAPKVPIKHPLFFSVISIRFSTTEVGEKHVGMHLIDEDGNSIIPPLDATVTVSSPPKGLNYRNQNIVLQLRDVSFPKYGDYTISWLLGGQELKTLSLRIVPPLRQTSTT